MGLLYTVLFYFLTLTTALSGGLGLLLKWAAIYRPDAYYVGAAGSQRVGTGSTPFEVLATFVFGLIYVLPLLGMVYAHWQGSAAAKRAAGLTPLAYHAASVYGVYIVFPDALNPAVAPLPAAAAQHAVYAVLFALLLWAAEDDDRLSRRSASAAR